jgi:hypothetical protein
MKVSNVEETEDAEEDDDDEDEEDLGQGIDGLSLTPAL